MAPDPSNSQPVISNSRVAAFTTPLVKNTSAPPGVRLPVNRSSLPVAVAELMFRGKSEMSWLTKLAFVRVHKVVSPLSP